MNLKSKLFGLAATTVLALSITTGAMAQSSPTVVTLSEGLCTLSVNAGTASFGSWTWNGSAYALDPGSSATAGLSGVVVSEWDNSCTISVKSAGLSNGSSTIPAGNIRVTTTTNPLFNNVPLTGSFQGADGFAGGIVGANFTLTGIPNSATPTTHTGTIDFQIGNGA